MQNLLENHKKCFSFIFWLILTISKCFFFAISYPILIPFALYDSTRWGIRNFYTEFWYSLIMLIYVHFSKITKNASSPSFVDRFLFFLFHLIELHEVHQTSTQFFEILARKLFMLIYAKFIQKSQINGSFPSFVNRFHCFSPTEIVWISLRDAGWAPHHWCASSHVSETALPW